MAASEAAVRVEGWTDLMRLHPILAAMGGADGAVPGALRTPFLKRMGDEHRRAQRLWCPCAPKVPRPSVYECAPPSRGESNVQTSQPVLYFRLLGLAGTSVCRWALIAAIVAMLGGARL